MANNRMYLVHRPTGKCVYLGKRMGLGWYDVPDDLADRLRSLFNETKFEHQDDFTLALENASAAPGCTDKWKHGDDNTILLDRSH